MAPARSSGSLPLTEAQDSVLDAQLLDPANPIFNTGQDVDIEGRLEVDAFREAVAGATDEADALAVRIAGNANGRYQTIDDEARARLEVVDLTTAADPRREAQARMQRDLETALDVARDRLARQILFTLGDARYVWYQRIHHVATDGYGTALMTARICDLYTARVESRAIGANALGAFSRVVADDRRYRASERRERDRRFWLDTFEDRPEVVGLASGAAVTSRTWRHASANASAAASGLQRIATRVALPWADVLVALVAAYVARQIERPEVVLGVSATNRLGTSAARVPALVMNVLPVRIPIDGNLSIESFAAGTALRLRKARRHGTYRSEQLRQDLGMRRDTHRLHGPVVNVLPFDLVPDLPGATSRLQTLGTGPVDDLIVTLRADAAAHRLQIELDANPVLYTDDDVAGHAQRLADFFQTAAQASPSVAALR